VDELSCREVVELVTDYLQGAMPFEERIRFEGHLDGCPHCVLYLEQMRGTIRALGRVGEEELAPPVRQGLLDAFRDWRRDRG